MLHIVILLLFAINLYAGPGQSRMSDEHNNNIPEKALHTAIKKAQKEVVKLLIERGADVDQRYDDQCPVHVAVSNPDLLEILLEAGASVDMITKPEGSTALHIACEKDEEDSCALLLKHGASLVARNQRGNVPLHRATAYGNTAIIKQLIAQPSCVIDVLQADGMTPLMLAAMRPSLESVDHLIACRANLNLQDNKGNTALHHAVRYWDSLPAVVALLLEKGANARIINKKKDVPLHIAAQKGFAQQVALLIPSSDINEVNAKGKTPLVKAICNRNYKTASLLLDAGANPNVGTPVPLWKAVKRGCNDGGSELMQKLIDKGADLTVIDEDGRTLTQIACCDTTRALLQNGMNKK